MRGKNFIGQLGALASVKGRSTTSITGVPTKEQLYSIFPSMRKEIQKTVETYYEQKHKLQSLIESYILPNMLEQARVYLDKGKISDCSAATQIIMQFIHEYKFDESKNSTMLQLLSQAYYLNGMVKSIGTLDDRREAEQCFSKSISYAKKCGNSDLQILSDKELRSLELNRYKLREGESFDSLQEDDDQKPSRKNT